MEILFKAKSLETGEWVEGSLSERTCDGYPRAYILSKTWDETEIEKYEQPMWEIDPKTLGQYIGKEDKKGVRIFGGDKVKIVREADDLLFKSPRIILSEIVFNRTAFRYLHEDGSGSVLGEIYLTTVEVIGNIHNK